MSRITELEIEGELEALESIVARHPAGIGRPGIEAEFAEAHGRNLPWRTLLRRLRLLADEDRVRMAGGGAQTVYVPGPALVLEAPAAEDDYVPISREGARVRALVRRPMMERRPVGYDRGFVDAYRPGKTWYLPRQLREQLHEMGRTPDGARPAGTYAREIFSRLLVDLSWASSRLEGNTYTRLDTLNLLEFGERAEGKELSEAQMILNHKAAIELLVSRADRIGFDLFTFQNLHAALSENLLADPADEGRLRTRIVEISRTTFHPIAIPQAIEECFRLVLSKAAAIPDPFEQAFFVMAHVPYLQPFADVNKRTSRLGANISLIRANLCPLSFVDVPERAYVEATLGVYALTRVDLLRDVFVWAYERSCAQYRVARDAVGEPDPLRMRYRGDLGTLVHEMVRAGEPPRMGLIRSWAEEHGIPAADVEGFTERALTLLVSLHQGNLHRYDLRLGEFAAWKAKFKQD
jgi:fido (protein-threonine AMPylation protein)